MINFDVLLFVDFVPIYLVVVLSQGVERFEDFTYQSFVVENVFCVLAVDLVFKAARPTAELAADASNIPANSPDVIFSISDN